MLEELRAARKTSHWTWFVFPQIAGPGHSPTARRYAISCREKAAAYLRHPVLGARLRECTALVNDIEGRTANQVFGTPDDLKFRTCMTRFAACAQNNRLFREALDSTSAARRMH